MIHLFICLCMLITICQEPNDLLTASFILRKLLSFIKHWPATMHLFTLPSCLHKSLINFSSILGIFVRKTAASVWRQLLLICSPCKGFLAPAPFPVRCILLMQLITSSLHRDFLSSFGGLPLLCIGGEEAVALLLS